MTTETTSVAALEAELEGISGLIGEAAAGGDEAEWTRLRMRKDALPLYIARQRAEPLQARLERLDEELDQLVTEMEATRNGPDPEVPGHVNMTPAAYRQARLQGIAHRQATVGRERREAQKQLEAVEAGQQG